MGKEVTYVRWTIFVLACLATGVLSYSYGVSEGREDRKGLIPIAECNERVTQSVKGAREDLMRAMIEHDKPFLRAVVPDLMERQQRRMDAEEGAAQALRDQGRS